MARTTKRELRERIRTLETEAQIARGDLLGPEPITFRTLTICFRDKTIELDGRTIRVDAECLSIPILSSWRIAIPKGSVEL